MACLGSALSEYGASEILNTEQGAALQRIVLNNRMTITMRQKNPLWSIRTRQ
ncbi:hypothetical protein [Deefgea salmonis]|uniref:Uncharacterized protein n=1 Tax=Deefgea salmonis TaxID=2875502 RepID=A0ABS8BGF5_9NEIS|nr:hypothetical protein [Deefgea salmonis]MCB5194699.1 hypothetical protein [Deefgea salmonis]